MITPHDKTIYQKELFSRYYWRFQYTHETLFPVAGVRQGGRIAAVCGKPYVQWCGRVPGRNLRLQALYSM